MNHYSFNDLKIGLTESFRITITQDMMEKFLSITGDCNPMHLDANFARNRGGFPQNIVYGMLTASFISTLGGVYLPGEKCFIQSLEVYFVKPVFVGDELTISGTVKSLDERVNVAGITVKIINQKEEKVLRGKLTVGVLENE